jgi:inhibitor of KinA
VTVTIEPAGDQGFTVRLGAGMDPELAAQVLAAVRRLDQGRPAGVLDVVPGHASLLVVHDPVAGDPAAVRAWVIDRLRDQPAPDPADDRRRVEIPVLYDPRLAPDLEDLARDKGLAVDALVALHTGAVYRCCLLGFRPGFPFLGGLDARLHAPRLATPRVRVPAGSVGIGGQQTGIYPVDSPGGWRIIGRTPLRLFDPGRLDPFLVHPGDAVVFHAIGPEMFREMGGVLDG